LFHRPHIIEESAMEREIALKILSDLRSDLREKYGVKSIAVFGSTARGEA